MEKPRETDSEKLFLLEVLVDQVFVSHSSLNLTRSLVTNVTDTCVLFQFLHYPPLVVCESDFIGFPANQTTTNHITFQSGKSCFFSLRVPKGPVMPTPLDINVSIIYKMKENVLPDKLEIGKTSIEMGDSFTQLLNTNMDENNDKLPLSKSITGTFDIKDEASKIVGSLTAFIRLSCFGKLIITQFSLNKDDEKSYLFKGTDLKQFYQDRGGRGSKIEDNQLFCGVKDNGKNNEPQFQTKSSYGDGVQLPESKRQQDCMPRQKQFCDEIKPDGYLMPNVYQSQVSPASYPYSASPTTQYQRHQPPSNTCVCPCPRPQNRMSSKTPTSVRTKNMGLEPGEVGVQDDQVIFQLPLKRPGDPITSRDKDVDSNIYYKLTSSEETCEGQQTNTVHVKSDDLPGMAGKGVVGPVSGLPVDDAHDMFLLKIGKKCDGDKRRNLELELRTPKMKEPKPPMTDQNTQYSETDIPSDGAGKKEAKEKGKKGKGKGNGKGKKKGKK